MKIHVNASSYAVSAAEREKRVAEPGFWKYFTVHMVVGEWNQN